MAWALAFSPSPSLSALFILYHSLESPVSRSTKLLHNLPLISKLSSTASSSSFVIASNNRQIFLSSPFHVLALRRYLHQHLSRRWVSNDHIFPALRPCLLSDAPAHSFIIYAALIRLLQMQPRPRSLQDPA